MRRLMLLRHAKSDWPMGVADLARPLAPRGRAEAPAIGGFMAREALRPHLALVSPAKRTRETWALVSAALAEPPPHKIDAALYMATAEALIARVRATDAGVQTLLLLGQNPGLEDPRPPPAVVGGAEDAARGVRGNPQAPAGARKNLGRVAAAHEIGEAEAEAD